MPFLFYGEKNMKTIELRHPILINNKEMKTLTYDFDAITCDDFTAAFNEAASRALTSAQNNKPTASIMENDGNVQLYLGMHAVMAVNPEIDIMDMERIKGFDLIQLTRIGRNFISGRAEESSDQSNLDEQSEATPESITQESEK